MQDNHPDVIRLEIGGKERLLKYRMASFTVAQTRHNVRFTLSMLSDPSFADIPILIWIGLLSDYPRLSLERVVRWVEEEEVDIPNVIRQILPKVTKVMGLQRGDLSTEEEQEASELEKGAESLEEQLAPLE